MVQDLSPTHPPSKIARSPAERMRLYRRRQQRGWLSIRIEITPDEIDELIKRRYLEPEDRKNVRAIEDAATAFFADGFSGA